MPETHADIPGTMRAWVLGDPGQLDLVDKPVPQPGPAEVLVRVDACAICATDLEVIGHGPPGLPGGELPFNKNFTPGHEYMGTVVALGPTVDEYVVGDRIAVEVPSSARVRPMPSTRRSRWSRVAGASVLAPLRTSPRWSMSSASSPITSISSGSAGRGRARCAGPPR